MIEINNLVTYYQNSQNRLIYLLSQGFDINHRVSGKTIMDIISGMRYSMVVNQHREPVPAVNKSYLLNLLAAGAELCQRLVRSIGLMLKGSMPQLVEVKQDTQGKPIYRQQIPDGKPAKTYQEKQENILIQNNVKTSELVGQSLFKNYPQHSGLAQSVSIGKLARFLAISDIGRVTQVSKVETGQGTNSKQLHEGSLIQYCYFFCCLLYCL